MNEQWFLLEKKRLDAKITQAEMAGYLGVTQPQISRYEQDPYSVPAGVLVKWHQICGDLAGAKGLDMDDPRIELQGRVRLIEGYAAVEPDHANVPEDRIPVRTSDFLKGIRVTAKKPRIGTFGAFDAGKSRLLNVILGGNCLPTGYQPATSVVCLIRHLNDKPAWQAEDVWIMRKGFELDKADDEQHCLEHKMFAGGYESLSQYGTHQGAGKEHKAYAAVVYMDSPVLLGAEVVDLPGYGHSSDDKDRAEMAQKMVDILIYASQATGFMDQNDMGYLGVLLRNLPALEKGRTAMAPLRNVFIMATHAHHVSQPGALTQILDGAAARSYKHLEYAIADRVAQVGTPISIEDYRSRFFAFSADDAGLRSAFESDLIELLTKVIPESTLYSLQNHIQLAKTESSDHCDRWIAGLSKALEEREKAQEEISAIMADEPNRVRRNNAYQQKIHGLVESFASESKDLISRTFAEQTNVAAIESMIRSRYEDKKEAHQLAANYLIDKVQKSVNDGVRVKANQLGEEIDDFLGGYGPSLSASLAGGLDFNPRVAFLSAMSGIGALGALTAWASIAAAGSNLGAYILIGQIVGWLSSIGISLGGAGTVMAFVASIGGPITLGILSAVAVALGVFAFFGDAWQTKLAKKIHESLVKQKAEQKMLDGVAKYWSDTRVAFDTAVGETEKAYQSKLASLHTLAFSTKREEIEAELALAKEMRSFFAGMPWRTIPT